MMPWWKVEVLLEVIDGVFGASSSPGVWTTLLGYGRLRLDRNKTLTKFQGLFPCIVFCSTANI